MLPSSNLKLFFGCPKEYVKNGEATVPFWVGFPSGGVKKSLRLLHSKGCDNREKETCCQREVWLAASLDFSLTHFFSIKKTLWWKWLAQLYCTYILVVRVSLLLCLSDDLEKADQAGRTKKVALRLVESPQKRGNWEKFNSLVGSSCVDPLLVQFLKGKPGKKSSFPSCDGGAFRVGNFEIRPRFLGSFHVKWVNGVEKITKLSHLLEADLFHLPLFREMERKRRPFQSQKNIHRIEDFSFSVTW